MSGSLTLGTDSLHSVLDASSNVLALLGLRWSAAPADARHPYGRQKIEILAALGIGVLIVVGLFEFGEAAVRALLAIGTRAPRRPGGLRDRARNDGRSTSSSPATSTARGTSSAASCFTPTPGTRSRTSTRRRRWSRPSSPSGPASPGRTRVATLLLVGLIGHAAWEVFRDNVPILIDAARLDPPRGRRAGPGRGRGEQRPSGAVARHAPAPSSWTSTCEVAADMTVAEAHEPRPCRSSGR